jgi:hypothetical protein
VSNYTQEFDRVAKHVFSEPKFVAQFEYLRDYPNPMQQILGQIPREAVEGFIDGEAWPEGVANQTVTAVDFGETPDWDWWEPRHDQPWRRQAHRDRVFHGSDR